MLKAKYYYRKIEDCCDVSVPDLLLGLKIDELGRLLCIISTYVNGRIIIYHYKILVHIYCIISNSTL